MKAWFMRVLYFGIPVVVLLASVLAMATGPILKRPMGDGDNVKARLESVSELALRDQWQEAGAAVEELHKTWDQVRGRLRFALETSEIETFDIELAELQGAVDARDHTQVRIAHRRLMALWKDLGS